MVNQGGGKKRDLSALLGTSKSGGGGKTSSASRASGKPASSILEQARAAAERAKRAKTTDLGVEQFQYLQEHGFVVLPAPDWLSG